MVASGRGPINPGLPDEEIDISILLRGRVVWAFDCGIELLVFQNGVLPVDQQCAVDPDCSLIVHRNDSLSLGRLHLKRSANDVDKRTLARGRADDQD